MTLAEPQLQSAYSHCLHIAQSHYENFPVASKLLNKQLRLPISAVYAFARSADDFADEGDLSQAQRLKRLNEYIVELDQIKKTLAQTPPVVLHPSNNPIFIALADTIYSYKIPIDLFYDLITAFKQDVTVQHYTDFNDILNYCQHSANPVGRILLYLNKSASAENLKDSDSICTGLQLINFYQDIAQDMDENNRLYIPLNELNTFSVSKDNIKNHLNNPHTQALYLAQIKRAQTIYQSGQALACRLSGRFGLEIKMIYAGGELMLNKLAKKSDSIYQRPRLTRLDKLKIVWRGIFACL